VHRHAAAPVPSSRRTAAFARAVRRAARRLLCPLWRLCHQLLTACTSSNLAS
jgi:hypothetical protein